MLAKANVDQALITRLEINTVLTKLLRVLINQWTQCRLLVSTAIRCAKPQKISRDEYIL